MPANSSRTHGVLYESEATLRLVDNELNAFQGSHALTAVETVRLIRERLREFTATDDAATNILNACDRARALVDELDGLELHASPDREKSAFVRSSLRDELLQMMRALQCQDITSPAPTSAPAHQAT